MNNRLGKTLNVKHFCSVSSSPSHVDIFKCGSISTVYRKMTFRNVFENIISLLVEMVGNDWK